MKEDGEKIYYGEIISPEKPKPELEAYPLLIPAEVKNVVHNDNRHYHYYTYIPHEGKEVSSDPYVRAGMAVGESVFVLGGLAVLLLQEGWRAIKRRAAEDKRVA